MGAVGTHGAERRAVVARYVMRVDAAGRMAVTRDSFARMKRLGGTEVEVLDD